MDSLPKYLNSPETAVYNKRGSPLRASTRQNNQRVKAKLFMLLRVIWIFWLCISMELPILSQPSATALTPAHAKLLRGLVGRNGKVILVFDSDTAGIRAAERSIEIFSKEYVNAYILVLPEGNDPDSFLFEHGSDAFSSVSTGAMSTVLFPDRNRDKNVMGSPWTEKIRVISELKSYLAAIEDPVARSLYVKELSERIDVDEAAVMEKIHESSSAGQKRTRSLHHGYPSEKTEIDMPEISKQDRMESLIVSMMFQFPSMIQEIRQRRLIDLFESKPLKLIARTILENDERQEGYGFLLSKISDDGIRSLAASLAISEISWVEYGAMKFLSQFERSRNRRKNVLPQDIKAAETANDQDTLLRLLKAGDRQKEEILAVLKTEGKVGKKAAP